MIDKLKIFVQDLNEDEAKAILFQTFLRIELLEETKYSKEEFAVDMKKILNDFLYFKTKSSVEMHRYQKVHIGFSDSISGSLKIMLQEMGLQDKEKVITLSDIFSVGPIWKLHEENGLSERYEWLTNHLIFDEDIEVAKQRFRDLCLEINSIPQTLPIFIWTGENAHEQAGLRFVLHLLKEKNNDIFLISLY